MLVCAGPEVLGEVNTLARSALIGVALAAVVVTFAHFGGWFTPNDGSGPRDLG